MPIILFIDTKANKYYVQAQGLAKASLQETEEEVLSIKLKVLFMKFYFYPLRKKVSKKKQKGRKNKLKQRKKSTRIRTVLRVLKTFKIKTLFLDLDTGNCISNAKLYPLFALLNANTSGNFSINFQERNQLVLCIKNRPITIIKSFINLKIR